MADRKYRVLQVAAVDITVAKLLRPLIDRLTAEGYEVEAVCSPGKFSDRMRTEGYVIHPLPTPRSLGPVALAKSFWGMYRLIGKGNYDIVHVHTPVAAGIGRMAATAAGAPIVLYTAHGFYFHEGMRPFVYRGNVLAERVLGLTTDLLMTQSAEDAQTAVIEKVRPADKVLWISNGVDVRAMRPAPDAEAARRSWGLAPGDRVVGFLGRMVREKGIIELLKAMEVAAKEVPGLVLLVAGDNKFAGDRDQEAESIVRGYVENKAPSFRIVFTGFIDEVDRFMHALDVFCLPSYREGMPRSIIEAMACGRPVIATNIRGSREEVLDGVTGYLVQLGDTSALAGAVVRVMRDPSGAAAMGARGRERAEAHFDEARVLDREVDAYRRLVARRFAITVPA
jgi:glycosyltransferase involved in cell wall biosynthesis